MSTAYGTLILGALTLMKLTHFIICFDMSLLGGSTAEILVLMIRFLFVFQALPPVGPHDVEPLHGLEGPHQDAGPGLLAGDVEAVVHPVDPVHEGGA